VVLALVVLAVVLALVVLALMATALVVAVVAFGGVVVVPVPAPIVRASGRPAVTVVMMTTTGRSEHRNGRSRC
jgi:hypothetical protein